MVVSTSPFVIAVTGGGLYNSGLDYSSDNAGHNLCEWIFYTSLAEAVKRGQPHNVAFIHVPPGNTEGEFEGGRGDLEDVRWRVGGPTGGEVEALLLGSAAPLLSQHIVVQTSVV